MIGKKDLSLTRIGLGLELIQEMMTKQDTGSRSMLQKFKLMLLFQEMVMMDLMEHGMQFGIVRLPCIS